MNTSKGSPPVGITGAAWLDASTKYFCCATLFLRATLHTNVQLRISFAPFPRYNFVTIMPTVDDVCPWLDEPIRLLEKLPRSTTLTSVAAGAGVPLPWLSKFAAGKFASPNILYVYRLYSYLTK